MNNHSWQSIRLIFNLNILALFISEPMQSRKMNINDIKDEESGGGGAALFARNITRYYHIKLQKQFVLLFITLSK